MRAKGVYHAILFLEGSMSANQLCHTWSEQIQQLCPTARKTPSHSLTQLLVGSGVEKLISA